ncbi:MAG: two-component system response regulator CreB [Comamonadaceae bacterium]|nr:two-component system response regulator CreB [Comamonadaceae bacterium]
MSERILIVEDEPAIAQTLAYALQAEGFATEWVALGAAALQALQLGAAPQPHQPQQQPFALAVLDVGLPDMSGFDLCRTIRQHGELPVLFLTARSDELDRIVGLEIGADDYVSKPFSPREVASRVRAILRRTRKGSAGAALAQLPPPDGGAAQQGQARGPFLHDEPGLRIAFHGQWLGLTRYEYRLLATLLARPGRVFSRAVLMEQVWSDAQESLERTVDAHIKTLRAKLRAVQADADPIETHRGLGYSLRA